MGKVEFDQGSNDWLEWRKGGIGGSEVSCVLGVNPWRSAHELYQEKIGEKDPQPWNPAMQRGTDLEPVAREMAFDETRIHMQPECWEDDEFPQLKCSLDGLDLFGETIQEIKCPGEKAHEIAVSGKVPGYYIPQIQYGMSITRAARCQYVSYRPEHKQPLVIFYIERDDDYIANMRKKVLEFWECVLSRTPPEALESDYVRIEKPEALKIAEQYADLIDARKALRDQDKILEKEMNILRAPLLDFTDGGNALVGCLRMTKSRRKGTLDVEKLAQDSGLSDEYISTFRKAETVIWTIAKTKGTL